MKTVLIISDNSPAAEHAARLALLIAQASHMNLMIAYIHSEKTQPDHQLVDDEAVGDMAEPVLASSFMEHLLALSAESEEFTPLLTEINISDHDELQLIDFINQDHIRLMVKGMYSDQTAHPGLNLNTILNRVLCPLLLVPITWEIKKLERLVYMADMRYCRIAVVRYLTELAHAFGADLSVAHFSAKGLPHLGEEYALSLFKSEVSSHVNYQQLYFNNIRERDIMKTYDVLISGLHNDLLAIVNHRFHFEELFGRYITENLPIFITIPLLIFPY